MRVAAENVCILKDAEAITKAFKGPHHLEDLTVDEVSLVTEPAILTEAESQAHAGFTVVKNHSEASRVPEAISKALSLRNGEDLMTSVQRLAAACRLKLMESGNSDGFYMYPLKVYQDRVVMGYMWGDDALSQSESKAVHYYACYFTQGADSKDFEIVKCNPMKVAMSELAVEPTTNTGTDLAQKSLDESVIEVAPEVTPEAAPVVEAAPEPVEVQVDKGLVNDPEMGSACVKALVTLQALERHHHSVHLQAQGNTAYADHLLFERLYSGIQSEIDGLSERIVVMFAPELVDAAARAADAALVLQAWESREPGPLTRALNAEMQLKSDLESILKMANVPQGLQNFLQGVADGHGSALYLIQQRLVPGTVTKSDDEPVGTPEVVAEGVEAPVEGASDPVGEAPAVEVERAAPAADLSAIIRTLTEAGRPFRIEFDAAGRPRVECGPTPEAQVVKSVEVPVPDSVQRLQKENDALRLQLARPLSSEPASEPVFKNANGGHAHPHDPTLAAATLQTRSI